MAGCSSPPVEPGASKSTTNVLLIVSDDERIGSEVATPHIYEWFKQGGTVFTHAFVTTPDCCPSRASIFTGQYVHNHGVASPSKIHLLNFAHTMQGTLKKAGYETGFAGKFLNTWPITRKPAFFDKWTIGEGYTGVQFNADGNVTTPDYGPNFVFAQGEKYIDEWENTDSKPWYLELTPSTPHEPFTPERRYENLQFPWKGLPSTHETDRSDKPPYVRTDNYSQATGESRRTDQFRTLRTLDDRFVEMIDHLQKADELKNTLVIFLSDNGYLWAEHGLTGKAVPYLSAVRVPMYMRGPGVKVKRDDGIVANIDVAPTVYQAAGVKPSYTVDGRSLLGPHHQRLLLEFRGGKVIPRWESLITKEWEYTEYEDGFREYYDLVADPYQLDNRPAAAPPSMSSLLTDARHCVGPVSCP